MFWYIFVFLFEEWWVVGNFSLRINFSLKDCVGTQLFLYHYVFANKFWIIHGEKKSYVINEGIHLYFQSETNISTKFTRNFVDYLTL